MSQGSGMSVTADPHLAGGASVVLAGLAILSLAGLWPTWRLCGAPGLVSAAWAVGVNIVVFTLNLAGICIVGRRFGLIAVGKFFMLTGMVRVMLMLGIAFIVASLAGERGSAFWLWAGGLYVVLVMMEAVWLANSVSGRRLRAAERREP